MRIYAICDRQPAASRKPSPFAIGVMFIYLLSPTTAIAQSAATLTNKALAHESEVAIVEVSGNTRTKSFSGKQKTTFQKRKNIYVASARYLMTEKNGAETAKTWDASLRYERELTDKWSAFLQYGSESDTHGGYTQRDNIDIGGKFYFIKTDVNAFFSELGLRQSHTNYSSSIKDTDNLSGRTYVEYSKDLNATTKIKAWLEYLPNFDNSNAWLLNYEPSLSVMLNQILSLKVAYLAKYHNEIESSDEKRLDTTFTTALVAKL